MEVDSEYDREKAVKEFDETKAGVKGLVDSGVMKIPKIFIHSPENLPNSAVDTSAGAHPQVPVIDLAGLESGRRMEIIDQLRKASETWGFFQMVNHGIAVSILNELLEGVRRFHEQTVEVKKELYSRGCDKKVRYYSNGDLHASRPVHWRDTLACDFLDSTLDLELVPLACRKDVGEYMKCISGLVEILSELLSEALGLPLNYLSSMECMKSKALTCLYYPACPEPDLTLGTAKHSDPVFLTVLLQDNIGGLQVLHQNHWINVPPLQGALVANIGDLMQIVSNDKFKSVEHRVLAQQVGPRVSAACFLYPSARTMSKPFGPIKELLSDTNKPIYREIFVKEYNEYYKAKGVDGTSALPQFKL